MKKSKCYVYEMLAFHIKFSFETLSLFLSKSFNLSVKKSNRKSESEAKKLGNSRRSQEINCPQMQNGSLPEQSRVTASERWLKVWEEEMGPYDSFEAEKEKR